MVERKLSELSGNPLVFFDLKGDGQPKRPFLFTCLPFEGSARESRE